METKAAAERVYDAIFDKMRYESRTPDAEPYADLMTKMFHHVMVDRIERAINGETVKTFEEEAREK